MRDLHVGRTLLLHGTFGVLTADDQRHEAQGSARTSFRGFAADSSDAGAVVCAAVHALRAARRCELRLDHCRDPSLRGHLTVPKLEHEHGPEQWRVVGLTPLMLNKETLDLVGPN